MNIKKYRFYNKYILSKSQLEEQEDLYKKLLRDETVLARSLLLKKYFNSILEQPVSSVLAVNEHGAFIIGNLKVDESSIKLVEPRSWGFEKLENKFHLMCHEFAHRIFSTARKRGIQIRIDRTVGEIHRILEKGASHFGRLEARMLDSLLKTLHNLVKRVIDSKRKLFKIIRFGRKPILRRDHRERIRQISKDIGRGLYAVSNEEEVDNTVGIVLQLYSFKENEKACIMLNRYWPHLIRLSSRQKTG